MTSSKKGNQWHFGMKAHIGVDTAHGLVHTLEVTTGKVSDYSMADTLLHGDEATAHGDRGYADKTRKPDRPREEDEPDPRWFVPFKRKKGCDTTPEEKRLNRIMAALRSAVEHPFRVLKRQFDLRRCDIVGCSRTSSTCSASLSLWPPGDRSQFHAALHHGNHGRPGSDTAEAGGCAQAL